MIRRTELTYLKGTNQIIARFRFRCLFPSGTAEESQYEMAYTADYADRIAQEAHASGLVLESTCAGYGQPNCSGPAAEMLGIVLRSQPGG
ncbi:MAG: hypothetical protein RBU21_07915 [FCB group bacterium]|nr:hypothetical protein [FCB group bacterium]